MEQSGVVGLSISGDAQRVTDFRDAPFCTKYVLAQRLGTEQIVGNRTPAYGNAFGNVPVAQTAIELES